MQLDGGTLFVYMIPFIDSNVLTNMAMEHFFGFHYLIYSLMNLFIPKEMGSHASTHVSVKNQMLFLSYIQLNLCQNYHQII